MPSFNTRNAATPTTDGYKKLLAASAKPAVLNEVRVYNNGSGTDYIQVHDAATTPTALTTMKAQFAVAAGGYAIVAFEGGLPCYNGIQIFGSSADDAVTAIAADDLHISTSIA